MKKTFTLALLFAAVSAVGASTILRPTPRDGKTMHRYVIRTGPGASVTAPATLQWLNQNDFDIAGVDRRQGTIEVIVDDEGLSQLSERGFTGQVQQSISPGKAANAIDPNYLNPQKVEAGLKALAARFPNLTRLEQIGTSIEGRPIWALLISKTPSRLDPRAADKPTILFDGLHHAREIMTSEIVFDVAQTLLESSRARVAKGTDLLDRWNVWVVPMLNVDGSNRVWTSDPWWRKNTHGDNLRIYGTDLNRNYPYRWGDCRGSSGSKSSDTYRGDAAGSEPETKALMRLAEMTTPAASLSYHSYSELVLYPYGCSGSLAGDNALFEKIGQELAARLPSDSGRGNYTAGTPWKTLYAVDGDSMSYIYSQYGSAAFTFEVNTEFQPPYSMREPTLVKHRAAWQYFIQRIDMNLLTLQLVDGRTGQRVPGVVDVSATNGRFAGNAWKTNANGTMFKVLDPGRYTIRVALADGRHAELVADMRGQPQHLDVTIP